jgi:PKD domain
MSRPSTRRRAAEPRRASSVFLLTLCLLALSGWQAAAADANVYCVAPASGCVGGTQPSLQAALTQVHADGVAGRIVLGSSTYTSPTSGFVYPGTAPLEIDGAGAGATTLALPPADNAKTVLNSTSPAALTLKGVRLLFSSGSTNDNGLKVTGPATVANVVVDGSPATTPSDGIILDGGGTISASTVTVPAVITAIGLQVNGSAATTVQDSTVGGVNAVVANGPGLVTVHRCALTGTSAGGAGIALAAYGGTVVADDSLLRAAGPNNNPSIGLALAPNSGAVSVTATQLTIVGNASEYGVLAQTLNAGESSTLNLTDSIIADPLMYAVYAQQTSGPVSVTINYSDFDPASVTVHGGASLTSGAHDAPSYVAPGFADPGGDFRLLASSPLLNFDPTALGNTPVGAGESSTDLAGGQRITGSGRDLGAYQHQAPTVSASAAPEAAGTGAPVSFAALGGTGTPGASLGYSWHFDDGGAAIGASVTHAFSTPGVHSATVVLTDSTGLTASATATASVVAPPVSVVAPPVITRAHESHARWRKTKLAGKHRVPVGTTFSFTLSQAATVRLVFTERVSGRRLGKRCLRQTRRNLRRPRCARALTAATMSFSGQAGANRIPFNGRSLAPGRYTVVITATNALGERSAPKMLSFLIVRRSAGR